MQNLIQKVNRVIAMANNGDHETRPALTESATFDEMRAALGEAGEAVIGSFWANNSDMRFVTETLKELNAART
jgi:hypothetical protein